MKNARLHLFLASFLMLFLELAMIRWIPGQVRIIAYFTNFVLVACFFGMGLGLLLHRRSFDAVRWSGPAMLALITLCLIFKRIWVLPAGELNNFLFLEYEGLSGTRAPLFYTLVVFYLAISAAFSNSG